MHDLLNEISTDLDVLEVMKIDIQANLNDEQPLSMKEGGIIREGIDTNLDELAGTAASIGKKWFKDLEQKKEFGSEIPSLKVKHNRQIGWYIFSRSPNHIYLKFQKLGREK